MLVYLTLDHMSYFTEWIIILYNYKVKQRDQWLGQLMFTDLEGHNQRICHCVKISFHVILFIFQSFQSVVARSAIHHTRCNPSTQGILSGWGGGKLIIYMYCMCTVDQSILIGCNPLQRKNTVPKAMHVHVICMHWTINWFRHFICQENDSVIFYY